MRRHALLCLLTLLLTHAIAAQEQRAFLEVVVNDMPAAESLVLLRGADAWIGVKALTAAGINGFAGRREVVNGTEFVSLASLGPDITFSVSEIDLRLTIKANPELLGRTVRDLSTGAPAGLVFKRNSSAFVNYAVNWDDRNQLDVFTETAASVKGALFYNTLAASRGSATRGITSLSFDERDRMRRWTVGDSFGYSGPLGGDAWIAGLTVAREFAIDPYFVRYPTLSLSTPIAVPSVMEIQVNGHVVRQEQVSPGRLDLRNLPMTLGRNDAHVIVRDAFGVTRELSSTYYLTTTALAPGVHDYQYSVGFRREGLSTESWDYRTPVALARHRVGLTNSVTAGGRVEVHPGRLMNAGPTVNLRLPLGEVEAATSVSRHRSEWGSAALAAFNYTGHPIGAGGSVIVSSKAYTTLSANPISQPPAAQVNVFASATIAGPLSVTTQHTLTRLHEGITRTRTSVLSNVRLSRNLELTASVTRSRDEHGRGHEAYAGITVLFGRNSSASVSHIRDDRGGRMAMDTQKPLPVGVGYGYQMRAESGPSPLVNGAVRYQNDHARYEVRQESVGTDVHTNVSVAGAVVAIGGETYATRPVQNSFALIRVPGVEGVRAFSSHQEVGRTSRDGSLLIPDLQAYYGNVLNIADADIPLQYSVRDVRMTLAPPYRGGAVAEFDVHRVQRVTGRILLNNAGDDVIPAYGDLSVTVDGNVISSPVGSAGEFYFENLQGGSHPASVEKDDLRCQFVLKVPTSDKPAIDIGVVRCTSEVKP